MSRATEENGRCARDLGRRLHAVTRKSHLPEITGHVAHDLQARISSSFVCKKEKWVTTICLITGVNKSCHSHVTATMQLLIFSNLGKYSTTQGIRIIFTGAASASRLPSKGECNFRTV